MEIIPPAMTKEELQADTKCRIPQVHKDAIENAIGQFVDQGAPPEEKEWVDHFRGFIADVLKNFKLEDEAPEASAYETEAVWFASGFAAKRKADIDKAVAAELADLKGEPQ